MEYLIDKTTLKLNGKDAKMGIVISNGHIIAFNRKGGFLQDIVSGAAILTAMAAPVVGIPIALAVLGADKLLNKPQQASLIDDIAKLRSKYKLSDDDIFVSNNNHSSATLTGGSFLTIGNTNILIEGLFSNGGETVQCKFETYFSESKDRIRRIFDNNGYISTVK